MQHEIHDKKWYALFVLSGEEDNVKERLQYKLKKGNIKIVVPKRKIRERKGGIWNDRIHNLFPGYVLLHGQIGLEEYYAFKEVPGIVTILKDKYDLLEIQEHEIAVISRLMCDNETIGSSSICVDQGRVTVIDGPLVGMEGLIESVDKRKGRVKVRLNFIGESRIIELSVSMVQSA